MRYCRKHRPCALLVLFFCFISGLHAHDTLVFHHATWKYLNDGSDQGTNWQMTSFNDAAWSSGNGVFGYGPVDGATIATTINNHPTTYFRKTISLTNPSFTHLDIKLLCDDGAIVYINGTQVVSYNMPIPWDYTSYASSAINGSDEGDYTQYTIPSSYLVNGSNVIAVELHNASATSTDLGFDLILTGEPPSVTRGPYIQNTTPTSATVRWRTDIAVKSFVEFGTSFSTYNLSTDSASLKTEHEVIISGLTPNTKYYYHLSSNGNDILSRQDSSYFFKTNPIHGTQSERVGFWVLGDQGSPGYWQDQVHAKFLDIYEDSLDLILMLGDNAYNNGTDTEFQNAVFDTKLDSVIRNTPIYSTVGNHEVRYVSAHSISTPETTPYYNIHNFPTQGEGGGLASGTESYFSWDYANVHFISLNAEEETLDSATSTMWAWCQNDLQQNIMDWTVVIVHQGPYTKGSHDSDGEAEHIKVRQNFIPLLERYGVDLVLSGHSHSYERSKFINGHYGYSNSYNSSLHELDGGYGRMANSGTGPNDCSYKKETIGTEAGKGAVYITAGSSSRISGGSLDHPVMKVNYNTRGSCYVEVFENKLSLQYIESNGDITDYFQIFKDIEIDSIQTTSSDMVNLEASWPDGPYIWSTGATTRGITVSLIGDSLITVQNEMGVNPCIIDSFEINYVPLPSVDFSLRVALEGAYDSSSGLMEDYLRTSGLLSQTDPYGLGTIASSSLFALTGNDAPVDWLKVQLRDANDSTLVIAEQAVLVQKDGDVMNFEGNTSINFSNIQDPCYVAILHYNHLGIMNTPPIDLSVSPMIDFTLGSTNVYSEGGAQARKNDGGYHVLWSGDANEDGTINVVDKNLYWRTENGSGVIYGTSKADFSLDGVINALDLNGFWRVNNSKVEQIPK